mmetsp:Transcript_20287/g.67675  ORF Transcript_20287/g.67675 Transcript_20287/m.67675 type:complete len:223 (+) Transcript_20287:559-1227(+)
MIRVFPISLPAHMDARASTKAGENCCNIKSSQDARDNCEEPVQPIRNLDRPSNKRTTCTGTETGGILPIHLRLGESFLHPSMPHSEVTPPSSTSTSSCSSSCLSRILACTSRTPTSRSCRSCQACARPTPPRRWTWAEESCTASCETCWTTSPPTTSPPTISPTTQPSPRCRHQKQAAEETSTESGWSFLRDATWDSLLPRFQTRKGLSSAQKQMASGLDPS